MKKIILPFLFILFAFITIPFFFRQFNFGKIDDTGGWTVGLFAIDDDLNLIENIKQRIKSNQFLKIDNSSTEFGNKIEFNADPFLFVYDSSLYLFVESKLKNDNAHISVYKVNYPNINVDYLGVAIDEQFHLSYPALYPVKDKIYLIPETQGSSNSLVYSSIDFPLKWKIIDTLISEEIKDPTMIFTSVDRGNVFYSKKSSLYKKSFEINYNGFITGKEIFITAGSSTRPGGGYLISRNDTFLCLQNNITGYGCSLDLYNLNDNRTLPFLKNIPNNPAFNGGIHHLNAIRYKDKILVCFDGRELKSVNPLYNWKLAFKQNYLTIFNFWFPKIDPFYPFNF